MHKGYAGSFRRGRFFLDARTGFGRESQVNDGGKAHPLDRSDCFGCDGSRAGAMEQTANVTSCLARASMDTPPPPVMRGLVLGAPAIPDMAAIWLPYLAQMTSLNPNPVER